MHIGRTTQFTFIACFLAFVSGAPIDTAAQHKEHEITATSYEPSQYTLADLYDKADIVARVEVLSGDTEHYETAVYKAKVKDGFKVAKKDDLLFVGPQIGLRLGWDYIVFLRKPEKLLESGNRRHAPYGLVRPATIMNQGYGAMEVSYECGFEGKDIKDRCDHAVRVCTDYVQLPGTLPAVPPLSEDSPFGCRWIRKDVFLGILRGFINTSP